MVQCSQVLTTAGGLPQGTQKKSWENDGLYFVTRKLAKQ